MNRINTTVRPRSPIHSSAQLLRGRVHYQDTSPPTDLKSLVLDFWQIRTADPQDVVPSQLLPTPLVRLRFMIFPDRVDSLLYGPSRSAKRKGLYVGRQVSFGASLSPERAAAVLGVGLSELMELRLDLRLLWPNEIPALADQLHSADFERRVQLLSAFLRHRLHQANQLPAAFVNAFRAIQRSDGERPIAEVCKSQGVSVRTLDRHFQHFVGLTPKQTSRVMRLQANLLRLASGRPVSGYSDQSHWIREFRSMIGVPPNTYVENIDGLHTWPNEYWRGTGLEYYGRSLQPIVRFPDWQGR